MSENILDYTSGPLLKTGQTTDRTPSGRTTKDDGGFQRGITESKEDAQYVILTAERYSGTTNITVNGKTDVHSNECVFDKVTSLMWSRTISASVFGTGAQNLLWDDTAGSNEDIFEYCDQANISQLAGYDDWRVPNLNELQSLLVYEFPSASFNSTAFPVITTGIMWSSTTTPTNTTRAMAVDNNSGDIVLALKTTTRYLTMLCRLGFE